MTAPSVSGSAVCCDRFGRYLPSHGIESDGGEVILDPNVVVSTAGGPVVVGTSTLRYERMPWLRIPGIPPANAPFPQGEWLSREKRLERFGRWRLEWEPGSRFVYHASSSMWVIAELIERRAGCDYREFVRERIALPLGLDDLRVGLPAELDARMADIAHVGEPLTPEQLSALGLPVLPVTEVTEDALAGFNQRHVREAGVPGGGGVTTAGDLALFYQALLSGRAPDGRVIWKPETLAMARQIRSGELTDPVLGKRANRALGLIIAGDAERKFRGFGHTGSPEMFGHNGAGGQLAWADPATGISLAYCTNGIDRNHVRQGRRGVSISSRAADCALDA